MQMMERYLKTDKRNNRMSFNLKPSPITAQQTHAAEEPRRKRTCMYSSIHTSIPHIHPYTHAHIHTYTRIHTCIHLRACACAADIDPCQTMEVVMPTASESTSAPTTRFITKRRALMSSKQGRS